MTVYFIGAGPGDPELITVRGQRLIRECQVVLFAGSLVPEAVIAGAGEDALVMGCQVKRHRARRRHIQLIAVKMFVLPMKDCHFAPQLVASTGIR